ncbi:MAG: hypothetical protein M0Z36_00870, partial [Thermaerobacter sp.]|nr:hypothetical protein [Thermaerobacter sp.]
MSRIWHSPAAVFYPAPAADHILSAVWYGLGVAVLVLAYRPFVGLLEGGQWGARMAATLTLALAAGSFPFVSHDVFAYFGEWRVMALYHRNPMVTPIAAIPRWRADPWLLRGGWEWTVNPYGPSWFLLVGLIGQAAPAGFAGFFLVWKSVALGLTLTQALMVHLLRRGSAVRLLVHPVVTIELLANAHNDVVMMTAMMAAYILWTR